MNPINYQEVFDAVPSWTSVPERLKLAGLAGEVKPGGSIVEIGALYGGMTIVMSLSNPQAKITVIDDFSWTPPGYEARPASKEELRRNLRAFEVTNVTVKEGDSREIGPKWKKPIDLLWIDGGHSYEFVHADLVNFAPHAQVVACHDWDNPFWPSIRQAVMDFLHEHDEFEISESVETVVVLRRK